LAQRLLTRAALQNALESDDPVAGLMLAREAAVQAANLFGPGSVGGRVGHLDLIEAELAVHRPVSKQDVLASLAALQRLDPSWRTSYRAARILGSLAAASGWFDVAAEAYDQAETLVTANQGPGTLEAATQHANRAGAVLQAGNTETADRLFQEALAMAAPAGHDRNPTWGHIAIAAATAAERIGDLRRANQLRHDAEALVPAAAPRITLRWG
jgi:tetratricopeptide (TPR) repeat protein